LRQRIGQLPRVPLAQKPTPLEDCPRLSAALGGLRILVKREDSTGLAFGGNKARQLELTLGAAKAQGADTIVQGAAAQSNHCRQAAAAAAKLGLDCYLCLTRDAKSEPVQGNLLLDYLLGAHVEFVDVPMGAAQQEAKLALAERLRAEGRNVYVIGPPEGPALGAIAYAEVMAEVMDQCDDRGIEPDYLYVCSAGATNAGLLLGQRALQAPFPVVAIAPIRWEGDTRARVAGMANDAAAKLGLELQFTAEDVINDENYVGEAYGRVTPAGLEALQLAARTEGLILDPVYTGKALAGLIGHLRQGRLRPDQTVVFIHTGGTPALFAYRDELWAALAAEMRA